LKNFHRKNDRDEKILIAINPEIRNAFTSDRPLFLMEIFHAHNRDHDRDEKIFDRDHWVD
jgi:hypothetical protein